MDNISVVAVAAVLDIDTVLKDDPDACRSGATTEGQNFFLAGNVLVLSFSSLDVSVDTSHENVDSPEADEEMGSKVKSDSSDFSARCGFFHIVPPGLNSYVLFGDFIGKALGIYSLK